MTSMRFADMHHRGGAFVIDWHIRTTPIALWGLWVFFEWFPGFWRAALAGDARLSTACHLLEPLLARTDVQFAGVLGVIVYLLYHPLVELAMQGASPGKRIMGIEVVSVGGGKPSAGQIFHRNVWRALEFLPFGWLWGWLAMRRSPENARMGDIRAGTRVVMRKV